MILLAGGTGTLGTLLVRNLNTSGEAVRVLTRDAGRAAALRDAGIEAIVGEVRSPATVAAASGGCATVVSAIHGFTAGRGTSPATIDRDANITLTRAAAANGVEHMVLVSVHGAAATHPMSLHRMKYAAEQAVIRSGLGWTILRPVPFLDTWIALIGARLPGSGKALVFGRGDNPVSFVSARDVANMIEQAIHDDTLRGRIIDVAGPDTLTFSQIAARLTAAAGTSARTSHVPLAALRAMSVLARPVAPAFARQAQAAVVMNTTDMTACHDSAPHDHQRAASRMRIRTGRATADSGGSPAVSGRHGVLGGPGVNQFEYCPRRLRGHEAEHVLQQRVDDRVYPVVLEGLPVVLGLPHLDVPQSGLGPVGEMRDQARRILRPDAFPDAGVDLGGDRHLVRECVCHLPALPVLTRRSFGSILV